MIKIEDVEFYHRGKFQFGKTHITRDIAAATIIPLHIPDPGLKLLEITKASGLVKLCAAFHWIESVESPTALPSSRGRGK